MWRDTKEALFGLAPIGPTLISAAAGIVIRGRVNPTIAMALVLVVGALIRGFGLGQIADFFSEGLSSVLKSTRGNVGMLA